MPRFPVGNFANINLAEKHGWNLGAVYFIQELDTPFGGSEEIPNPEGRRNLQQTLLLQAEFGLTPRTGLSGTLPIRNVQAEGELDLHTTGLGDMEIFLRHAVIPMTLRNKFNLNIMGGLGFPTGRSEGLELTSENIQFGVGDFTALTGAELSYLFRPTISAYFRSQARFVLGSNSDGYRFGDAFDNALGASFRFRASRYQLLAQISTLHLEQDHRNGVPVVSRGGRWMYGSLGMRFRTGERGGVVALAQYLVDVDVRGDQLASPWNFLIGYDIRLPGHPDGEDHGRRDPLPAVPGSG